MWAEVIGDPIAHSKSPAIHRHWLRLAGIEADYRATRVTADGLHAWIASRRADPDWAGANLTMPLKEAVVPLLDGTDERAGQLGAVNCVVRQADGRLIGHNTDVDGVAKPLSAHARAAYPDHVATHVQIIGAGGAARAAVMGACAAGLGDFHFYNRTAEKAVAMARWIGLPDHLGHPLATIGPIRNPDDGPDDQRYSHVIINASPMGMAGHDPVPIDLESYCPDTLVFDMVYHPLETPLLAEARRLGLSTIDGLEMLVEQAATAFGLLFGASPPRGGDAGLRAMLTGRA
jgi:shikimate dehydrogenase